MKISITPKESCLTLLSLALIFLFYCCKKTEETTGVPAVAGFTYTSILSAPVTVQFTNTSTVPPGDTATYTWDFGDSTFADTTTVTHVYMMAGIYMVKLIQTLSGGVADTVIVALDLSSSTPGPSGSSNRVQGTSTAGFDYNIVSRTYTATFTSTSTGAENYFWKFGDGTTLGTDSTTVIHRYNPGTYHVSLIAGTSSSIDTAGATITF